MISLQPREQFTLVRQLPNHTDLATYYVQAVIRNSLSGEIIATVRLTDGGNGRFTKVWEVASDVSGQGFYIDITISVYTDSGYTTKSDAHGDDNDQYLVFDRVIKHGGGGGSVDVDYKKIQKMMDALMKQMMDSMPKMDTEPMMKMMMEMKKEIGMIEMPEMEKMDHTPVLKAIGTLQKDMIMAIEKKPITPITDLSGLEKTISENIKSKEPNLDAVFSAFEQIKKILTDFVTEYTSREGAKEKFDEIKKVLTPIFAGEEFKPKPIVKPVDERVKRLTDKGL